MHVVVAVTPAHPARRSLSKRRNQPATWFQLATVRLTSLRSHPQYRCVRDAADFAEDRRVQRLGVSKVPVRISACVIATS
jgi:hypothetical protein